MRSSSEPWRANQAYVWIVIGSVLRGRRAGHDRVREPVAVTLGRQVVLELGDEKAAVGEDEDAELACGIHESSRRDGLPGSGRVSEAVTTGRSRVVSVELGLEGSVFDEPRVEVVVDLLVELRFRDDPVAAAATAVPVAVLVDPVLGRCDELGQHAGERVDLVTPQLGPGRGAHRFLRQDSLEPEHEAVAHLPARRGLCEARRHLLEGVVERGTSCRVGRESFGHLLAVVDERLAEPGSGSTCSLGQIELGFRRQRRCGLCFVHARSTDCCAAPSECLRSRVSRRA